MHGQSHTLPIGLDDYGDPFAGDARSAVLIDDDVADDDLGFIGALLGIVGQVASAKMQKDQQEDALDAQKEAEKDSAKLIAKKLKMEQRAASKAARRDARAAALAAPTVISGGGVPGWVWPAAGAAVGLVVLNVVMKRRR